MKTKIRILAAGLMIALASAAPLTAGNAPREALFGVTFAHNQLITVDPSTGAATVVGSLGDTIYATGIAMRGDGLFVFDQVNQRIREVNKISGRLISSIDIGASDAKGEGAIAFRSDGVGFLASPLNSDNVPVNDFYMFTIDPATGTGTSIRLGSTGVAIDAMAFDFDGTLYALGQADSTLYTINTTTGAATSVGTLNPDVVMNSPISGMAIGQASVGGAEQIYASIDDRLYIIDPATAAAHPASEDVLNFSPLISSVSGLTFATGAGTLGNMAGRLKVGTGENVGIAGFIVRGTPDKKVVIRAIGPSLPLSSGVLADPALELFDGQGQSIVINDDFASSPDANEIRDLGLAPRDPKESAILRSLPAGNYTAVIRGADGGTGVGLIEVYDVDSGSGSRLGNLSTRGFVQPGDGSLIGGLIIRGSAAQRVVVRAIGPDLANRGVNNVLADPNVEIFDGNGTSVKMNDNFGTDPDAAEIETVGLSPNDPLESATIVSLAPGNYTAVVRGSGSGTGVALVESFNLSEGSPPIR